MVKVRNAVSGKALLASLMSVGTFLLSTAPGFSRGAVDVDDDRLPGNVVPSAYTLFIHPVPSPGPGEGKFTCKDFIDVDVKEPLSEIVLNSAELKIGKSGMHFRARSDRNEGVVSKRKRTDRTLITP